MKARFYDRHERRQYALTELLCRHILDDPEMRIGAAREHLQRFMADDPHQRPYFLMWLQVLEWSPEEIVQALLEDSPQGDLLRETRPAFGVLPAEESERVLAECRDQA